MEVKGGDIMPHGKIPFISKKCLKHSNIGNFVHENSKPIVMLGGGHGQDGLNYLISKKIEHNINLEYNNGVRLGNVPIHQYRSKRRKNGQAWFPKTWSKKDIYNAGIHVMKLKRNQKRQDNKKYEAVYKGVIVGTRTKKGFITSIFPLYSQKCGIKNK
jgi:hypothetical protein